VKRCSAAYAVLRIEDDAQSAAPPTYNRVPHWPDPTPSSESPRSALGASPKGYRQRSGQAGSAAIAEVGLIHANRVPLAGTEN